MSAPTDNTNLQTNTTTNATTKNPNTVLKEVYKVWKYTRQFHKKQFARKINNTIWNKVLPFKALKKHIDSTKNLQELWVKTKTTKGNTPVPTTPAVSEHLKNIILTRDNWTREADAIQGLESYIGLSKTSPEILGNLFSDNKALVKTDETIFWEAAVRVIGKNFALKVRSTFRYQLVSIQKTKRNR